MDYKKIEALKNALRSLARKGCKVSIPSFGISGMLVGIGFSPYWTAAADSMMEKLEIDIQDVNGRVIPFYFYRIVDYDVLSRDGKDIEEMKNASMDIHVLSRGSKKGDLEVEKIRLDVSAGTC